MTTALISKASLLVLLLLSLDGLLSSFLTLRCLLVWFLLALVFLLLSRISLLYIYPVIGEPSGPLGLSQVIEATTYLYRTCYRVLRILAMNHAHTCYESCRSLHDMHKGLTNLFELK